MTQLEGCIGTSGFTGSQCGSVLACHVTKHHHADKDVVWDIAGPNSRVCKFGGQHYNLLNYVLSIVK